MDLAAAKPSVLQMKNASFENEQLASLNSNIHSFRLENVNLDVKAVSQQLK